MSVNLSSVSNVSFFETVSKSTSTANATVTPNVMQLIPFKVPSPCFLEEVSGSIAVTQAGKVFEVSIYSSDKVKLNSSGTIEIPDVGTFTAHFKDLMLSTGSYFIALCHNATTATFSTNNASPYYFATNTIPSPSTIAEDLSYVATGALSLTIKTKSRFILDGLQSEILTGIRVLGINGSQPWAWNTATGKLCYSVNAGASFIDLMSLPSSPILQGGSPLDIQFNGTNAYLLLNNGRMAKSSTLDAGAVWEDVSCPVSDSFFRSTAKVRPYGFVLFSGYIFMGEYSQSPNELLGGPRILKMNISTNVWTVSKQFANCRHIHSLTAIGSSTLWVSIGDLNWGSDVGIHRLVPAGFGDPDSWVRWTDFTAPRNQFYPVDFVLQSGVSGVQNGIYGASDIQGSHVLFCKTAGSAGQFNLSTLVYAPSTSPTSETVRSIVATATGTLFYWTAETTKQALYMSVPPYDNRIKLVDYSHLPQLFLSRAVISGSYLLMYDKRIKIPLVIKPMSILS